MKANSLINETSPYLLQHAYNPVEWYAWNDETLEKAKKENKMLLISIGYAACHWCHVMEHESFEDADVADIMNENFICVKVDREERPDVDQVYMNAAYLINGNGGWPLNALALPDARPYFAGTYFPKARWIQVLQYFSDLYKNEKQKLQEQASNVLRGINEIELVPKNSSDFLFSNKDLDEVFEGIYKRADTERGGNAGTIKFPMPSIWDFLLKYYHSSKTAKALEVVDTTLQQMCCGGIYDQIGGGFSRYSTDANWHVPHFEKMLYDNGQLVSLYSKAFQQTPNDLYKRIVYETIAFVKRELMSADGLFYSSLDADSEGEEGKFYVWTQDEINNFLKEDAELFCDYYGITEEGNWEHGNNIPDINFGKKNDLSKYNLSKNELIDKADQLKLKLLTARSTRIRPQTDDKILTAWNALMITGFIDAYKAFGDLDFFNVAKTSIDFYLKNIITAKGSLYRNFKNGKATIPAFLDDYAFIINALINFYQVSFVESYLQKAKELSNYVIRHFFDSNSGMFYYTDDQYSNLIARKLEIPDNVIPSSNSEMSKNLLLLSIYFEDENFKNISLQLVKNVFEDIKKTPSYYGNWASSLALQIQAPYEVAVIGGNWMEKLSELQKYYLPNSIFLGGISEGTLPLLKGKLVKDKTLIYICRNKTCRLPVDEVINAVNQLK